jgi:hypothetical protein
MTYIKKEWAIKIDVKAINTETVVCNMYTGLLCEEITIHRDSYEVLLEEGFFYREHEEINEDSRQEDIVIATTGVYKMPTVTVTG